jgi:hypothetical protein
MPMSPRTLRPRQTGRYAALRVGLVAYWPMNESASAGDVTAEDWTNRGNNLTSNNTVPSVTGIRGDGREFTAANSEWLGAAGANNDLKFADGRDWTLAGWAWIPTWTTGRYLIANDSSGNREILISTAVQNGNNLSIQLSPGGVAGVSTTAFAGSNLATSTWHFFAFYYTHSTGVLDGRVNNSSTSLPGTRTGSPLLQSTQPLNLGRRQFTGANDYFGGRLDEVAKWDRVLTETELTTLYNSGAGIDLRQ